MTFIDPLEIVLVLITLMISTTNSVHRIIRLYRGQSMLLAFITGLTVFGKWLEDPNETNTLILVLLVIVLPLVLAWFIEPVLVRATVAKGVLYRVDEEEMRAAKRIWRRNEDVTTSKAQELLIFTGLVVLAVLVAFKLEIELNSRIGLMVSLTLHLVGLYNMVVKRDIISQVIGLLIMDHGLYLAVVKIVEIPNPAFTFVFGLIFYTLITIAILVFMLPMVRRLAGGINLDELAAESQLEG